MKSVMNSVRIPSVNSVLDGIRGQSGCRRLVLLVGLVAAVSACSKAQIVKSNKPMVLPISVASITPDSGPVAGGTQVTITGTGFYPGTTVTIGGISCGNVQIVSVTQMTCVTGAATLAGTDTVNIVTPLAAINSGSYSYLDSTPPIASAIVSGGVFGTSGTILVRASIGVPSGAGPGDVATAPGMIKVGGIQGVIQAQNAFMTGGSTP